MREKTELKLMFWFSVFYLALFTILAITRGNYEFIYYAAILVALIWVIVIYHKKMHLTKSVLAGLTILGLMHLLGGNMHIFGIRLYDIWLIPSILRYDMFVHTFGTFMAAFVVYSLIHPHIDKKIHQNPILLSLLLVFMAMGLGSFNEIIELLAVLFFGAAKAVGDYFNNAFDLFFNLIGSIIACFFIMHYHNKKK